MKKMWVTGLVLTLGLTCVTFAEESAPQAPPMAPVAAMPVMNAVTETAAPQKEAQKAQQVKPTKEEKAALKKEKAAQKQLAQKAKKAKEAEKSVKAPKRDVSNSKDEKALAKAAKTNFKGEFVGRSFEGNLQVVLRNHPDFKKLVEEEVELERQSRELVRQHRAEKNPQKKAALETQLRTAVERHFVVRQERRLYELKLIEERVGNLRKQIEARNGKKDRIVEKRLEDLIGTDEDLRF